jgi:hypothetical protein
MSYKKFLVPVGVAVAALFSGSADSVAKPSVAHSNAPGQLIATERESQDPVIQKLLYQIGDDAHMLLLRKTASGSIYGQHMSHMSHESHYSHRSHRSSY